MRTVLVVADPPGKRIGSGGSTVACLIEVLDRELADRPDADRADPAIWEDALSKLRILLIHAGGDSRRLPGYGPCGKPFVPVPVFDKTAIPATLFDIQLPVYLDLPDSSSPGQVVVASGDVYVEFDSRSVCFPSGVTGLGCFASPATAAQHGVYAASSDGRVRRFLQKPGVEAQRAAGAVTPDGMTLLDTGVLNFDAASVCRLLRSFALRLDDNDRLCQEGPLADAARLHGFDLYREFCCAPGEGGSLDEYRQTVAAAGSCWSRQQLDHFFDAVASLDFHVCAPPTCQFLHLGTSRRLLEDGLALFRHRGSALGAEHGAAESERPAIDDSRSETAARGDRSSRPLSINNEFAKGGGIEGGLAWVEGCRIQAPLKLEGENLVVGVDVAAPLALSRGCCLDVIGGFGRSGLPVQFIRCYHIDDFSAAGGSDEAAALFCGRSITDWIAAAGATPDDVWPGEVAREQRDLWRARLFPAASAPSCIDDWLWMFEPEKASTDRHRRWLSADRYSLAEIAELANRDAHFGRRMRIRHRQLVQDFETLFDRSSDFSAADLALVLLEDDLSSDLPTLISGPSRIPNADFTQARVLHSVGSAIERLSLLPGRPAEEFLAAVNKAIPSLAAVLPGTVPPDQELPAGRLAEFLKQAAFDSLRRTILGGDERAGEGERGRGGDKERGKPGEEEEMPDTGRLSPSPRLPLSSSPPLLVWGRAPVRLDLGGGWTDTPPCSLESGGCVLNVAVKLNDRWPVHVWARFIDEPAVRLVSIDQGSRVEIRDAEELLDFCDPAAEFSLAKAAVAQHCSLSLDERAGRLSFADVLERLGGGVEVTTLSALPTGSGLGTSSIMAAVVLAALNRLTGHQMTLRELFHATLRVEQSLTTGGGWQDQVGGVIGGAKLISSTAGLVPDLQTEPVPSKLLDPKANGGQILLYCTGITRRAKNVLDKVVSRYLDRERTAMKTLDEIRRLPQQLSEAISAEDLEAVGRLVGRSWQLNKRLDPSATSADIEALFARIARFTWGAKLLGAGGGGFLLMICRSAEDARRVSSDLSEKPPNRQARFYEFEVCHEGLSVQVL